jgi:hypothetical protein
MSKYLWRAMILICLAHLAAPNLAISQQVKPKVEAKQQSMEDIARREAADSIARFKNTYDELLLKLAEEKLKISQGILSAIAWIGGTVAALLAVLAFFGIKVTGEVVKGMLKDFGEKASVELATVRQSIEKDIQEASKATWFKAEAELANAMTKIEKAGTDVTELRARFYLRMGFLQWELALQQPAEQKRRLLQFAISDTEAVLKSGVQEEKLVLMAKGNLAYYYAELGIVDKRGIALSYAQETKQKADEHKMPEWLVNYGYVRMRYAVSVEELDEVVAYLEALPKLYPSLKQEADDYLSQAGERRKSLKAGG